MFIPKAPEVRQAPRKELFWKEHRVVCLEPDMQEDASSAQYLDGATQDSGSCR